MEKQFSAETGLVGKLLVIGVAAGALLAAAASRESGNSPANKNREEAPAEQAPPADQWGDMANDLPSVDNEASGDDNLDFSAAGTTTTSLKRPSTTSSSTTTSTVAKVTSTTVPVTTTVITQAPKPTTPETKTSLRYTDGQLREEAVELLDLVTNKKRPTQQVETGTNYYIRMIATGEQKKLEKPLWMSRYSNQQTGNRHDNVLVGCMADKNSGSLIPKIEGVDFTVIGAELTNTAKPLFDLTLFEVKDGQVLGGIDRDSAVPVCVMSDWQSPHTTTTLKQ